MVRKRARLGEDNDPLTSTDKVLAGFEELSKSTSQEVNKSESQEVEDDATNKTNKPTSQQASKSAIRQVRRKKTSPSNTSKQDTREVDKLESQQVNKLVVRKSTFQLSSTILERLDRLHLELQLELGKLDAPYKEVIVEEAIAQLLEVAGENRSDLVEALLERQGQRK
ncbi:MAG: hypothetical protein HC815_32590 [Richelia sp. RM1_1_1]|nr:hypothetical protein [Richelia sp. RM1_1_1]